jgi:hypothetical protein
MSVTFLLASGLSNPEREKVERLDYKIQQLLNEAFISDRCAWLSDAATGGRAINLVPAGGNRTPLVTLTPEDFLLPDETFVAKIRSALS